MSTAGAQGVKFDSSPVRPTTSPNTRLICSCRVVAPRKGCSQRFIVLILITSLFFKNLSWPRAISDNSCQLRLPSGSYRYITTMTQLTTCVNYNVDVVQILN